MTHDKLPHDIMPSRQNATFSMSNTFQVQETAAECNEYQDDNNSSIQYFYFGTSFSLLSIPFTKDLRQVLRDKWNKQPWSVHQFTHISPAYTLAGSNRPAHSLNSQSLTKHSNLTSPPISFACTISHSLFFYIIFCIDMVRVRIRLWLWLWLWLELC